MRPSCMTSSPKVVNQQNLGRHARCRFIFENVETNTNKNIEVVTGAYIGLINLKVGRKKTLTSLGSSHAKAQFEMDRYAIIRSPFNLLLFLSSR